MDFPPRNLLDLAPADFPQPEFPPAADHLLTSQQAYGAYDVDRTFGFDIGFGFGLHAQFPNESSAITQPHPLHPFSPPRVLPDDKQHDADAVGNSQSISAAPTSPMGPPAQPRKRKAPTLHADAWEPYKHRILELHVTQGLPLPEVVKKMEDEYGFKATLRQYRTRISQWGKDKKVKPQEMQAIVRKRQRRKLIETSKGELVFEVRDSVVPAQKIDRWMKRNEVVESSLYAPSPAASTPSAVGCHTVSERGSPAVISAHSPAALIFSPGAVYYAAESPQMPSPALSSVSSIIRLQGSAFAGQSPSLAYRSLPNLQSGFTRTSSTLESQMDIDARPRYKQDEEERLREQIFKAETSMGTSFSESSDKLYRLGALLIAQGRYKTAEEVIRRLVESHESQSSNSDDGVDKLKALDLLGQVLDYQGLYIKAERLCRRVLQGREKVLGPEHPATLSSVSHLGWELYSQGKYKEAEAMHRRALEGRERVRGLEHPDTLTSVSHLGLVLEKQGKYEEAEAMHRRALEVNEKVLGPERLETFASLNHLGLVLENQGKYEEAEVMHRRDLEGSEKVLGPEHPDTLTSVSQLGSVLERQSRYKEAEVMQRRALEAREKVLGPEHPSTLISVDRLAFLFYRQQLYSAALELCQRAYSGYVKALGTQHPRTIACFNLYESVVKHIENNN